MKQTYALKILKAGRNVYLTGPAGSGKTHVLREYISYLKDRGVGMGLTAPTGIAATHFGGTTLHSWAGIGLKSYLSRKDISNIVQKEHIWKRFDKAKVLIIDEVSMLSAELFGSIDKLARAMKDRDKPFGGMQLVLSGDFFQLPPIQKGDASGAFAIESDAWSASDIRICYLEEQHRHTDKKIEAILNEFRAGSVSDASRELLLNQKENKNKSSIRATRLYTHNVDVDAQNTEELAKLPGEIHTYKMHTSGKAAVVESLKKGILAPEELNLKKGAIVMFVKNSFDKGFVNGTLGKVIDFKYEGPIIKTFSGKRITAHTMEWIVEEDGKVKGKVEQIPLRLAWAITVHKSQGMSLDAAQIDLSKSFVPGQGYVALSRLCTLEGLVLHGLNDMALRVHDGVLQTDKILQNDSSKWEKVIQRFSDSEIKAMHDEFIKNSGGTLDEEEIKKNKDSVVEGIKEKVPTHLQTYALTEKGLTISEIAKERNMTKGTIITHLEKLKEVSEKVDLKRFKPDTKDFNKMKKAFGESGDTKLTPVYKKLKGVYSYDDLKLCRLFL